jgi:hypothetical protein
MMMNLKTYSGQEMTSSKVIGTLAVREVGKPNSFQHTLMKMMMRNRRMMKHSKFTRTTGVTGLPLRLKRIR